MTNNAEISWFTLPGVGEGVGYGYAAVEMIHALQSNGIKVSFNSPTPKVSISFSQPDFYEGTLEQYRIGYTHWESNKLPDSWHLRMNDMDEIWVASNFLFDLFLDNNVNERIRLIPHGINPEIWKINNRFIADKFIFMHVGSPAERKGAQRVADAFLQVFGDNEDAYLLFKSNGPTEARWTSPRGGFGNINTHPRITVIEENLSVYDLATLYDTAHCMVYPTNGEGFGLIPFQAIATGMPTICTDATGCADFAKLSVPLDSRPTKGMGVHLGDWVEPDFDDLCDKMLYVYDNYDKVKQKTVQSAQILHAKQTWAQMADLMIDALDEKIFQRA